MSKGSSGAQYRGYAFEREVAAIFRTLGVRVQHSTILAGSQIDILLEEQTPTGGLIKTAVECKAYNKSVGVDVVVQIAGLTTLLKQRGLIDRAIIVSLSGFTPAARSAADNMGVELLELAGLN